MQNLILRPLLISKKKSVPMDQIAHLLDMREVHSSSPGLSRVDSKDPLPVSDIKHDDGRFKTHGHSSNQSLEQRVPVVPVAPLNSDLSSKKKKTSAPMDLLDDWSQMSLNLLVHCYALSHSVSRCVANPNPRKSAFNA